MAGPAYLVQVPDLEKRIHRYRSGTRGCLTPSSDAALSFNLFRWLALNVSLFCLPLTLLFALHISRVVRTNVILSTFTRTSVVSLLVVSGLILLFIANAAFPAFMRYQVIIRSSIARHPRKRRTHWSFITPRRWRQYFAPEDRFFSIFIRGILTTTIVLSVFKSTTFAQIQFNLGHHRDRAVSGAINHHCHYFETVESFPRILYPHQTIQQAGIEPDSHIYVRFPLLGGAKSSSTAMDIDSENPDDVQGPNQGSSSRQRRQTTNSKKYTEAIDAEKLDENGLPTTRTSAPQRKRRRAPKKAKNSTQDTLDESDEAYSGTDDSESSGVDSDSEHEIEISNEELADSLPSKTIPATSKRRKASGSKEKAPGKKRARRLPAEEHSSSPLPTANSAPSIAVTKDKASVGKKTNAVRGGYEVLQVLARQSEGG
ncbi:hypothetical protein B0H14DRAFT_3142933 [Mycena olivaceomarginata]|nr:hypothetical protein B0H14DRAFT_3161418 [Mycena olivaceomarginata]KAJ7832221.1 hypothetical protein B0H14DRAFT_3142933 [Mycena olivaceomarginata]